MMWLQQKCHEKVIRVTAIPTSINSADIGTKALARARMRGLRGGRVPRHRAQDAERQGR